MTMTETPPTEVGQDDLLKMTKDELRSLAESCGLEIPSSAPKATIVEAIEDYRAKVAAAADASLAEPEEIEGETVEETEEPLDEETKEAISTAVALREEPPAQVPALLPTTGEFDAMLAIAGRIAATQMVPVAYRGKPDDVLAAILTGREMGLGPMQSLRDIYVVDGKPSLSANLLLARLRTGGVVIEESESTAERAWIRARRRDTGEVAEVEWTYEEASKITYRTKGGSKPLVSKDNWTNYRADMLWARAVGRLARRLGPDLIGAAMPYTSEEVQDWDDRDAGDPGEAARGYGSDQRAGQWIAPKDWRELSVRLTEQLGSDEAAAWMEELAEKGYKRQSLGEVVKADDLDAGVKADLWRRMLVVLRGLEDAERPVDGPLTFFVGCRRVIQEVIYKAFDETVALTGPSWALDPEEAKSLPQRDDVLGRKPQEPVSGSEQETAGEEPSEPSEDASGAEDAPEAAPGMTPADDIKF